MAEEPSPPPAEDEDESREREVYPFMDAAAKGSTTIAIRAGWADSETQEVQGELVVNYDGRADSVAAERAYETALEWYRDAVASLLQQSQQSE